MDVLEKQIKPPYRKYLDEEEDDEFDELALISTEVLVYQCRASFWTPTIQRIAKLIGSMGSVLQDDIVYFL